MISASSPRPVPPPRLHGWRAGIVWAVFILDLAFVTAVWVIAGPSPDVGWLQLLFVAMVVSLGSVGSLVATRKPRDPVGWLLVLAALMTTIAISGADYVRLSMERFDGSLPGTIALAWLQGVVFLPAFAIVFVIVPLFFPEGRLLSRRWRWVVVLAIVAIAVIVMPSAFDPGLLTNTNVDNPLAIQGFQGLDDVLGLANLLMVVILFPLALSACVLRYRRGSRTTRQQLKWYATAIVFTLLSSSLSLAGGALGVQVVSDVGWILSVTGLVLLPIAIGIAILRYRLYEIDRIVSRTVSWALVTGVLVGAFAVLVVGLQDLLSPVTSENTLAVAVSTLVVASLFQPLRRRVQRTVDRRFDRARYDGDRLALAFADRLRDEVGIDTITADILTTVESAQRPVALALWIR